MKLIAHAITNPADAQRALNAGVDFIEVDVSERIIFSRFTTRHHGVLGKFGIGPSLVPMLEANFKDRLLLDIKHARYSYNFARKLKALLEKFDIKKIPICGEEWEIVSEISNASNLLPFYSLEETKQWTELKKILPSLKKPSGFSISYSLVDHQLMNEITKISPRCQIWAWTVNDIPEVKRLELLGVDGIITDEWEKFYQK